MADSEISKLYYTIGEVAKIFDVKTSLIRFWEREFDIIKPQKSRKGNRRFTKQDVENFRKIYGLVKEQGYTLQGARDYLTNEISNKSPLSEVLTTLQKIRISLETLRDEISGLNYREVANRLDKRN